MAYVHEPIAHRPDQGDVGGAVEREEIVVVLKQNDGLGIQLAGQSERAVRVDDRGSLIRGQSAVRVLEDAHREFGAQETRYGSVHDALVELA